MLRKGTCRRKWRAVGANPAKRQKKPYAWSAMPTAVRMRKRLKRMRRKPPKKKAVLGERGHAEGGSMQSEGNKGGPLARDRRRGCL